MKPLDPIDANDETPDGVNLNSDITRRQWLLLLGELAALAGVSGFIPESSAFLAGQENVTALPPGLYRPSATDLVHALSSAHHQIPPLLDSETDYAKPAATPYAPQFFSVQEFRTVTRIVEILLGTVDRESLAQSAQWVDLWFYCSTGVRQAAQKLAPMHRALAVAYFGEDTMRDLETADPASVGRDGIAALQKLSADRHQKEFADLTIAEQTELVRLMSTSVQGVPLRKFFDLLRAHTIRGYYTTAAGIKELDYKGNAYYTTCPGCDSPREDSQK
jgi:hypothetical protein